MQEVLIKYNPYKVITTIKVNDEEPKKDSKLVQFLNQRFQLWVDKIPSLIAEEYNDDEFNITFWGTDLDYQDLLAAIKDAERQNLHFVVKQVKAKEFGDKEKELKKLFEKASKLPFEQLQSPAVANAFDLAFNELLEVIVVATMSAGKSTLINALLGKKLMPSKQGACTATITKIQDNDQATFRAIAVDTQKNIIEDISNLDYSKMVALNKNESVSEINVQGDIPFVNSDEASLVLIDTPGPDNARDKRHGLVTAKALDQSSKMLVLFVMNGGKLHDEAQDGFLHKIAASMSVGGKQSRDRFLFVINKIDAYQTIPDEEGEAADDDIVNETIPDTIQYLEQRGIENPNIFLLGALPALLIREYQNTDDIAKKEKILEELQPIAKKLINQPQLHLEQYPKLVHSCQEKIDNELQEAIKNNDILGQALVHSGIRGIEETIRMYVTKYCRPAKITNVVNTFSHELDSAEAFEKTRKEIALREDEQKKLEQLIIKIENKLKSKDENELFKKKISSLEISSKLTANIDDLIKNVEVDLTQFFNNCSSEMEENEARNKIRSFIELANEKQDEFQISVESLLTNDVKVQGQNLLNEYIKRLKAISDEFKVEGLEIDLTSFVRGNLASLNPNLILDASIDTRIERHTEQRSRTVRRERHGFDRLFHPSCWIDPSYEVTKYYDVEVKEEISFVSREKLANQLVSPIRKALFEERTTVLDFAKTETKNIKEYFYEKFDEVDRILAEKTQELRETVQSKESSKKALKEANSLLQQLEEVKNELESILEI